MLKPRYYQSNAFDSFFEYTSQNKGKNPLIVLPTGSGKSFLQALIVEKMLTFKDTRILLLTHQKELIKQNAQELDNYLKNGIFSDIGVYSAGLKKRDTQNRILFAGIQSVYNKAWELGFFDLVLVDEVHMVNSANTGMYRTFLSEVQKINNKIVIGGLTASPFRLKSGMLTEGSEAIFDDICYEVSIKELIDPDHPKNLDKKQYLCNLISKGAENEVDLSKVHIQAGDYNKKEMQVAFFANDMVEKAISEALVFTANRRKVLVFCAGIEHCEAVTTLLKKKGQSVECVHSKKSNGENDLNIKRFKENKIKYLINVNSLCFDEETKILTSEGFVGIEEMTSYHKIAAWKKNDDVEFTPPLSIVKRYRRKEENMITFGHKKGFSANIRVTSNHRMVIRYGERSKKIKVIKAEESFNRFWTIVPSFGCCEPEKLFAKTPEYKQDIKSHIRVTAFHYRKRGFSAEKARELATNQVKRLRSMRYKHPFELSKDECFFIGFWLGDGSKSRGRVSISQSKRYPDNIKIIDDLLTRLRIAHSRRVCPPDKKTINKSILWTFARGTGGFGQSVKKGYFEIEIYLEKEGTKLLKGLNKKQLESLLEGFFLADGLHHSKNKTKRKVIQGTQIKLYTLLQEICSLRGISATIRKGSKEKNIKYKQRYIFTYGARKNWVYNSKKNIKIEKKYKKEKVWCVTSSTSFLICKRRGKVFVAGNSTGFNEKTIDCIILLRSTVSPGLLLQMAGRGFRLHPDKKDCLILDYGTNISRLGPIDKLKVVMKKNKKREKSEPLIKMCPECRSLLYVQAKVCPDCGYDFPIDEKPKHEETASTSNVLSEYIRPKTYDVTEVSYWKHQKRGGGTPTLRIDYHINMLEKYSKWVCLEHFGYARSKAIQWLREVYDRIDIHFVDEALEVCNKFKKPTQITVDLNDKFPEIIDIVYEEESPEVCQEAKESDLESLVF